MFKAVILGAVMTWAVALVLGTQGSSGGPLAVHTITLIEYKMHWSWSLFMASSAFFWILTLLQR